MTRVALLMGGRNSEHEVSVVSAQGVMAALDPTRFEAIPVLIARDGGWTWDGRPVALCPSVSVHRSVPGTDLCTGGLITLDDAAWHPVDVVFPVLHGPNGEDGTIQGMCEVAALPCVGAGVTASAIAIDKALFKTIAIAEGIPVAAGIAVEASRWASHEAGVREEIAGLLGYPCFAKPARLGSSVGISRVASPDELQSAMDLAFAHDSKVLIERAVVGREVEVGLLGNDEVTVSPPGELTYEGDWYDYDTKYQPGRAELTVPAPLEPQVAERARELALAAFRAVGCEGMGRVDFFIEADGTVRVSELNTIPGFTPTSAYPSLMAACGVSYPELVTRLIDLAFERSSQRAFYKS